MIPKVIHQVWVGDEHPRKIEVICNDNLWSMHPGWRSNIVTNTTLLKRYATDDQIALFASYLAQDRLSHPIATFWADTIKLCLMYEYGGIYIDWDMWMIKRFDDVLDLEDNRIHMFETGEARVGEHMFISPPKCTIWLEVLESFLNLDYAKPTQPFMNLNLWRDYPDVVVHPYTMTYPHRKNESKKYYHLFKNTIALHCWNGNKYNPAKLKTISHIYPVAL